MKRPWQSLSDDEEPESPAATDALSSQTEKPRTDATYGQKNAFPGLDDDGECSDTETLEALQYLRSVRSEAQNIPNLLCAPKALVDDSAETPDSANASSRGYYSDGAYIAAPVLGPTKPSNIHTAGPRNAKSTPDLLDAQDAYHTALLQRFDALSNRLRKPISSRADASTPSSFENSYFDSTRRRAEKARWIHLLHNQAPALLAVANMDQGTVLSVLELVTERCVVITPIWSAEKQKRFGAWIWSLLGKLGDMGTLGSEEVSVVRELGKKAVSVANALERLLKAGAATVDSGRAGNELLEDELNRHKASLLAMLDFQEPEGVAGRPTADEGLSDAIETVEDVENNTTLPDTITTSPPPRRQRNTSSPLSDEERDEGTRQRPPPTSVSKDVQQALVATLDMIITTAGERYGQRDLLDGRATLWDLEPPPNPST